MRDIAGLISAARTVRFLTGFPISPSLIGMHGTQSGEQPHIWLVEDDEDMVTLLRFYLEREGYQVTSTTDGRLAKDAITGSDI